MSAGALDQPRGHADPLGDFGEAQRIAAVGRADDQHPLAPRGDRLDRVLAVGRGVANILAARRADRGEASIAARRRSPRCRRPTSVVWVRNERFSGSATSSAATSSSVSTSVIEPSGTWPKVPITSGWPRMADEQDVAPGLDQPLRLAVDLGDQRAGGVEKIEAALAGRGGDRFGHAMGRKYHRPAVGDLDRARRRTPRPSLCSRSTTKRLWTISWRT